MFRSVRFGEPWRAPLHPFVYAIRPVRVGADRDRLSRSTFLPASALSLSMQPPSVRDSGHTRLSKP